MKYLYFIFPFNSIMICSNQYNVCHNYKFINGSFSFSPITVKSVLCVCAAFSVKIAAELYWSNNGWQTNGVVTPMGQPKPPSYIRKSH